MVNIAPLHVYTYSQPMCLPERAQGRQAVKQEQLRRNSKGEA